MELIGKRIIKLHREISSKFPELSRMAVAVYDRDEGTLRTFVDSTVGHEPIKHHLVALEDVPSLKALADERRPRIIDDLKELEGSSSAHSRWLLDEGFRSSYTLPLFADDALIGFLFFDADVPRYFDHIVIETMRVYSDLIGSVLLSEIAPLYTLRGALHTAQSLTHKRDIETSQHILRMSHYAHLLAQKLSPDLDLSDEYVNYVLQYAPMHDIGKVGIPDEILLKPGKLTPDEFEVIKTHVQIGLDVVDMLEKEFNLGGFGHLEVLRNTIGCHHETLGWIGLPGRAGR